MKPKALISAILSFIFSFNFLLGAPFITQVSPNHGPAAGGTSVTITGSGFTGVTQVSFGPSTATFTFNSDTEITASAPQSVPGTVHISVTVGADTSPTTPADRYTYQGNWFAYVSGNGSDGSPKAWYIDLGNTSNVDNITLLNQSVPFGIAITPDGRTAYVSDDFTIVPNTTYVNAIDLVNNTPTGIQCPGHIFSDFVAITPDGTTAFPTFYSENSIGQIDLATNNFLGTTGATENNPEGIAISPDGHKIYVANSQSSSVTVFTVGGGSTQIPLSPYPWTLAITPNGNEVYVITQDQVSFINTTSNVATPISIPGALNLYGIAISPDGEFVYVSGASNTIPSSVYQIKSSTKNVVGPIDCGSGTLTGIAIAPDGQKAYVNNTEMHSISVIDLTQAPPGATGSIPIPNSGSLNFIAITPDPAPAADFSVTAGAAGSSTQFDASSSVSPVGTIVTYAWNFGDGTLISTPNPLISHTYATAGTYNVELTVTNSAGTSVTHTFTGQTVSNAGSVENAQITKSVLISSPTPEPPPLFCGKVKKHHHHLHLKTGWTQSPSPDIVGYEMYKKHTLLRSTSFLNFKKTLHPKAFYKHHLHTYKLHLEKLYKVRAVNSAEFKSDFTPLHIK